MKHLDWEVRMSESDKLLEEFIKARDKEFDSPSFDEDMEVYLSACRQREGADWAYEYCQERMRQLQLKYDICKQMLEETREKYMY